MVLQAVLARFSNKNSKLSAIALGIIGISIAVGASTSLGFNQASLETYLTEMEMVPITPLEPYSPPPAPSPSPGIQPSPSPKGSPVPYPRTTPTPVSTVMPNPSPGYSPRPTSSPSPRPTPISSTKPTPVSTVKPYPTPISSSRPTATPQPWPTPVPSGHRPVISTTSLPKGVVEKPYATTVTAYDVDAKDRLGMVISGLPKGLGQAGCSIHTGWQGRRIIQCQIKGKPAQVGSYKVVVMVKDSAGNLVGRTLLLTIAKKGTFIPTF